MMQRIVINICYGGFGLSETALNLYRAYAGIKEDDQFYDFDICRDDPILLQVIDQMGVSECEGNFSRLKIVEIPDGVEWEIAEHDGKEHVAECHRTWS
jgi:hypothetical protein